MPETESTRQSPENDAPREPWEAYTADRWWLGDPACPDHGATARTDGTCMVGGCRYVSNPIPVAERLTDDEWEGVVSNVFALDAGFTGKLRQTIERILTDRLARVTPPASTDTEARR